MSLWVAFAWAAEPLGYLAPPALSQALEGPEPPLVLDLRGTDAYREGTIAGALDAGSDPAAFVIDNRGGEVVLIPPDGIDPEPWGARLAELGYRVQVLAGGIVAWRAAGLPEVGPQASFVQPGSVPHAIPRIVCDRNAPDEGSN